METKSKYLTPDNPEAFRGLEKLPKPPYRPFECFVCHGFGKWILTRDAYGPGKHFLASCSDCGGYGYTVYEITHRHDWKFTANLGRCFNRYTCSICGKVDDVDSGD